MYWLMHELVQQNNSDDLSFLGKKKAPLQFNDGARNYIKAKMSTKLFLFRLRISMSITKYWLYLQLTCSYETEMEFLKMKLLE